MDPLTLSPRLWPSMALLPPQRGPTNNGSAAFLKEVPRLQAVMSAQAPVRLGWTQGRVKARHSERGHFTGDQWADSTGISHGWERVFKQLAHDSQHCGGLGKAHRLEELQFKCKGVCYRTRESRCYRWNLKAGRSSFCSIRPSTDGMWSTRITEGKST